MIKHMFKHQLDCIINENMQFDVDADDVVDGKKTEMKVISLKDTNAENNELLAEHGILFGDVDDE